MAGFQDQLENFLEHFDEMQRSSDSDDMFNQEFLVSASAQNTVVGLDPKLWALRAYTPLGVV